VPDVAGLLIPAIAALVQAKVAPVVPLVGVYANSALLHIVGALVLLNVGTGVTTTITLCVFVHPFAVSVYTYVTVIGVFSVVLFNVSRGSPVPVAAGLLMPATTARLQSNIVPAVPLVGVYENSVLLQIPGGVRELVNTGIGLTVTTTLLVVELHPFAFKV